MTRVDGVFGTRRVANATTAGSKSSRVNHLDST